MRFALFFVVLLEDFHCLFYIGDLENAGCAAASGARGAVGIGYVDMVCGKLFSDGGESAGPVVEGNTEDVGLVKWHTGFGEDIFSFFWGVEDNPQHPVLNGVHYGHGSNVDFDPGKFAEDVSKNTRLVDHKDRKL